MPKIPLTDLLSECDRLLEPARFEDYCVNGLQVPGPDTIETIATGVSAHASLIERAAAREADLLLVHHGLFWGAGVRAIDKVLHSRLKLLIEADIALAAYHLPLDAHPEIGNNALLAKRLGATDLIPFAEHAGEPIGFVATLRDGPVDTAELLARTQRATAREPLHLPGGPAEIARIAIVTGGGADYLQAAASAGAQALVTGEPREPATALARELNIHLIAAGHHATETFGVEALGEHLAGAFGVRHVFLDVPNPV